MGKEYFTVLIFVESCRLAKKNSCANYQPDCIPIFWGSLLPMNFAEELEYHCECLPFCLALYNGVAHLATTDLVLV